MIDNECAVLGIKQILAKFTDHEVISLCTTVTQGLLKNKIQSREDAVDAIIKYSPDTTSFLKRKIITRNLMFEYLDESGIKLQLPVTKDELIMTIAQAWDKRKINVSINTSNLSHIVTNNCLTVQSKTTNIDTNFDKTPIGYATSDNTLCMQDLDVLTTSFHGAANINSLGDHSNESHLGSNSVNIKDLEIMSLQFCKWFYTLLNQTEQIGSDNFYPDASIQIHLVSDSAFQVEEALSNSESVCNLLFKVKMQHGLFFNPNLNQDGIKGKLDPHGLVMIMCCGTLHVNNVISGVFEQIFALARDPTSINNWKVKNTSLVLRSKAGVTSMPILGDKMLQIAS